MSVGDEDVGLSAEGCLLDIDVISAAVPVGQTAVQQNPAPVHLEHMHGAGDLPGSAYESELHCSSPLAIVRTNGRGTEFTVPPRLASRLVRDVGTR